MYRAELAKSDEGFGCLLSSRGGRIYVRAASGPAEGAYIEARGEVLRSGRNLTFVRGLITGDGKACLNFSGTIMRRPLKRD